MSPPSLDPASSLYSEKEAGGSSKLPHARESEVSVSCSGEIANCSSEVEADQAGIECQANLGADGEGELICPDGPDHSGTADSSRMHGSMGYLQRTSPLSSPLLSFPLPDKLDLYLT